MGDKAKQMDIEGAGIHRFGQGLARYPARGQSNVQKVAVSAVVEKDRDTVSLIRQDQSRDERAFPGRRFGSSTSTSTLCITGEPALLVDRRRQNGWSDPSTDICSPAGGAVAHPRRGERPSCIGSGESLWTLEAEVGDDARE